MERNIERLKYELESYVEILERRYEEAKIDLERMEKHSSSDFGLHTAQWMHDTRQSRLNSFCRAMEFVEENLDIELDIPVRR